MKKYILLFCIAAFAFACSKPENKEPMAPVSEDEILLEVDFTVTDGTPDVKGIKKAWANNDVIYVFFNGDYYYHGYLKIKYNNSQKKWLVDSWEGDAQSVVAATTSGILSAVYAPIDKIGGYIDRTSGLSYKTAKGTSYLGLYLIAEKAPYTVSNGKLTATINMVPHEEKMVQFYMEPKHRDGSNIYDTYASNEENNQEINRFTLQVKKNANSAVAFQNPYRLSSLLDDGSFQFSNSGALYNYVDPYYYGGLCFALTDFSVNTGVEAILIRLNDSKTNKSYDFTLQLSSASWWNNKAYSAFKLPALNQKDSSDNYYWKENN